jgi:adenylosuccinate synthase
MRHILLLSGAVGAGKTTLSTALHERYGARIVKTRELIAALKPDADNTRGGLQAAGEALDVQQGGRWVADALLELAPPEDFVVVDAVRIVAQVDAVRKQFPSVRVQHVHLQAPGEVLVERYARRNRPGDEGTSYETVRANATEASIDDLAAVSDVLIDTSRNRPEDVLVRTAARLGLYHAREDALVDVLVGAQWGSEGKGHIAWYIAREYDILMRVGGPNAGHSTIDPYKFHLLPSGTIVNPRAMILIGPGATINVETILREIRDCKVDASRIAIDPQVMIIEKSDPAYEAATLAVIGTTAQGGGYAGARRIMRSRMKDAPPVRQARDIPELAPYVRPTLEILEDAYHAGKRVFVEGTQGTGLSLLHGPFPHVTSRDTTVSGTLAECGIPPSRVRRSIMVVRSYPIRVAGTSGPLPQETTWDTIAERAGLRAADLHEREVTTTTHRPRRVGEFDWELFRRACTLNGPTDLALSFADYIDGENQNARRFEQLSPETIRFIEEIERVGDANVSLISTRFHPRSIIDRRSW